MHTLTKNAQTRGWYLHDGERVLHNQLLHEANALLIRCYLCAQIRQIVGQVACARAPGPRRRRRQQTRDAGLVESAARDELERFDGGALLEQVLGKRWHLLQGNFIFNKHAR